MSNSIIGDKGYIQFCYICEAAIIYLNIYKIRVKACRGVKGKKYKDLLQFNDSVLHMICISIRARYEGFYNKQTPN